VCRIAAVPIDAGYGRVRLWQQRLRPRQVVSTAQVLMQTRRDLSQQLVARRVAAGVVHHLEPVEIEIK
jgi:hypothetical protein